jgi:hypothetical protein
MQPEKLLLRLPDDIRDLRKPGFDGTLERDGAPER